jgi:hypothetical protein
LGGVIAGLAEGAGAGGVEVIEAPGDLGEAPAVELNVAEVALLTVGVVEHLVAIGQFDLLVAALVGGVGQVVREAFEAEVGGRRVALAVGGDAHPLREGELVRAGQAPPLTVAAHALVNGPAAGPGHQVVRCAAAGAGVVWEDGEAVEGDAEEALEIIAREAGAASGYVAGPEAAVRPVADVADEEEAVEAAVAGEAGGVGHRAVGHWNGHAAVVEEVVTAGAGGGHRQHAQRLAVDHRKGVPQGAVEAPEQAVVLRAPARNAPAALGHVVRQAHLAAVAVVDLAVGRHAGSPYEHEAGGETVRRLARAVQLQRVVLGAGRAREVQLEGQAVRGHAQRVAVQLVLCLAGLADRTAGVGVAVGRAVAGPADRAVEGGAPHAAPALPRGQVVAGAVDGDAIFAGGVEHEAGEAAHADASLGLGGGVEAEAVVVFALAGGGVVGEVGEALEACGGLRGEGETVGIDEVADADAVGVGFVVGDALEADEDVLVVDLAVVDGCVAESVGEVEAREAGGAGALGGVEAVGEVAGLLHQHEPLLALIAHVVA